MRNGRSRSGGGADVAMCENQLSFRSPPVVFSNEEWNYAVFTTAKQ